MYADTQRLGKHPPPQTPSPSREEREGAEHWQHHGDRVTYQELLGKSKAREDLVVKEASKLEDLVEIHHLEASHPSFTGAT